MVLQATPTYINYLLIGTVASGNPFALVSRESGFLTSVHGKAAGQAGMMK